MSEPVPPPVEASGFLASFPTAEDLLAAPNAQRFRLFMLEQSEQHGLAEELSWLGEAMDELMELLAFCYASAAGAEAANELLWDLTQTIKDVAKADDGTLSRFVCEAILHPDVPELMRQAIRMSMVAYLREPRSPLTDEVLALVEEVAEMAGPQEWRIHQLFCGLFRNWHHEVGHHNALVAVFESIETESDAVTVASRLLKMSVLYETRLKPFILTLDQAMAAAGLFKEDRRQLVGRALKRICTALSSELPQHAHLLDPAWVGLRNAALHGEVRRSPDALGELVTRDRSKERHWTLETTAVELERIEALVAPMGAIPLAVSVLANQYTLRSQEAVEEQMVLMYEPMFQWARQWLADNPLDGGSPS